MHIAIILEWLPQSSNKCKLKEQQNKNKKSEKSIARR
jgi:hypothetical protein